MDLPPLEGFQKIPEPTGSLFSAAEKQNSIPAGIRRSIKPSTPTNSNPELNFKVNLTNKFNALENFEPQYIPVAGTSTDTKNKNHTPSKTNNNLNTTVLKLPPPVMFKITLNYRAQMKPLTDKMPTLRSKMTGDYLKLYTDTFHKYHQLNPILQQLKYEFYSITPKAERLIKVVIKGIPSDTKTTDIQ
ncbi:hypothetical protein TNCV_2678091 [Trichonephila clavipes]|nr:hypothetical protein TNCV_2678091 [Trichonephila clavipes]